MHGRIVGPRREFDVEPCSGIHIHGLFIYYGARRDVAIGLDADALEQRGFTAKQIHLRRLRTSGHLSK